MTVPERPEGDHHELAELTGHAAPKRLAQAGAAEFDLAASIGGVRGLLESVVPFTVFSVLYGITQDLRLSVISALVPAALLALWRIVAREPLTQAISGLAGIGIGAYVATKTGNASDFFLPNIIKNAALLAAYAISIPVRWPLIGVMLGPVLGEMFHWRQVPARRRAYVVATWLWVAMFGIRLLVQIPLWATDQVTLLGTLNAFVLGLPLFGLVVWLCWMVLRRVPVAVPPERGPRDDPARVTERA